MPSPNFNKSFAWTVLGMALVLCALARIYRPIFSAGWVYEDHDSAILISRVFTTWTWRFVNTPMSAHLLNLSLFVLSAALLVGWSRALGVSDLGQWAIAALWLCAPVAVESVAYAASRGELFALCAILAAAWLVVLPMTVYTVVSIVGLLTLAAFSKESGILGIGLVTMVYAWTRATWRPLVYLGVVVSAWSVSHFAYLTTIGSTPLAATSTVALPLWALNQTTAFHHWLMSWSWGTGLTPDLDVDAVPMAARALSVAFVAGVIGCAWACRDRYRTVTLGLIWCLLAVLPRLLIRTPQSYLNAHQMIVPLAGLTLAYGAVITTLERA